MGRRGFRNAFLPTDINAGTKTKSRLQNVNPRLPILTVGNSFAAYSFKYTKIIFVGWSPKLITECVSDSNQIDVPDFTSTI